MTSAMRSMVATFVAALLLTQLLLTAGAFAAEFPTDRPFCGKEGLWVQILGSGGAELDDRRAAAAYLVWIDGVARLLVDAGPGTSVRFDEAGAKLEDLDALVFTQMNAGHASDLAGIVSGGQLGNRERPLPVYGPAGNDVMPSTSEVVQRLFGRRGAFPLLADFLTYKSGGFRIKTHNVGATGIKPSRRFTNERMRLTTIPVDHGPIPAIAWRVQVEVQTEAGPVMQSLVFTGDFNNRKDLMSSFAADADALIVSHSIPEVARGAARDLHLLPSQIGRIASQAKVRMVILGQRMNRTRGRESQTREAIERNFTGPLIYANELECWGM